MNLVDATIEYFLPTLDPSAAVAIADLRAEHRHEELVDRLDASADFEIRLESLPPSVREVLKVESTHRGLAERLVDGVFQDDPRSVVATWATSRPSWLLDAPGVIILAVAQLAHSYGLQKEASALFREAGDLGIQQPVSYARAAFDAHVAGEPEDSAEMITKADAAGGGGFVDLVRASVDGDWDSVLTALSESEATQDPFAGVLRSVAIGQTQDIDAEIDYLSRLVETHPTYANMAVRLAELLLARSQSPSTASRDGDRRRGLDLATDARDKIRKWRGDSGPAVEIACDAAMLAGDGAKVLMLGREPPDGEALHEEAVRPEVHFLVAQAAIALGDQELLKTLTSTASGFREALLIAELAASEDVSPAELAGRFQRAWDLVASEGDKVALWLSASLKGVEPLPGIDELGRRDDDLPVICLGRRHVAGQRYQDAIQLLRPRRDSEPIRRLLVHTYVSQGDSLAAVTELLDMAKRFSNFDYELDAVKILSDVNNIQEAASHVDSLLSLIGPVHRDRGLLHEIGVAAAHNRHDWQDMEQRVRAWINDIGPTCRCRWFLALAVYNNVDHEGAWRIVREDRSCGPETSLDAQLWITLLARFEPTSETLTEILELVDRFPGDAEVRNSATNAFFVTSPKLDHISESELDRWHAMIADRTENPTPGDAFVSISVSGDDPISFAESLRPHLEPQAEQLSYWLASVRDGPWSHGMISRAAGRPYTAVLAQRPLGYLPIASSDDGVLEIDLACAEAALAGGHVVVDNSVVVVGSFIRERWSQLVACFVRAEVAPTARRDAAIAADRLMPRTNETLGWDTQGNQLVRQTLDDSLLDQLEARLTWVHEQVSLLSVAGQTEDSGPPGNDGAWMDSFRIAREASLPLWADDVGLRTLARNEGVVTFGTDALLRALVVSGRIPSGDADDAVAALRMEYCVDLPFDATWMVKQADQNEGLSGPALLVASRPSFWLKPRDAFDLWSRITSTAAVHDMATVPGWVHAAIVGIGSAVPGDSEALQLMTGILVRAATIVDSSPETFATCAAAAKDGASSTGHQDPTEQALSELFELLTRQVGSAGAATMTARLGSALVDEHQTSLRRILFDV